MQLRNRDVLKQAVDKAMAREGKDNAIVRSRRSAKL